MPSPPAGDRPLICTVQDAVPGAVTEELLQETELKALTVDAITCVAQPHIQQNAIAKSGGRNGKEVESLEQLKLSFLRKVP